MEFIPYSFVKMFSVFFQQRTVSPELLCSYNEQCLLSCCAPSCVES